ncbi:hypothetical protein ACSBL2_16760 [Pedobacter sp. AW31-3R]|uniref:hypothetical protein n=1 Tax=Pedobacter sp. AW31-3R TaxID=3445781 RepID=UPI003F9F683D
MKIITHKIIAFVIVLLSCAQFSYSQSASGIGLRLGLNKPITSDYNVGAGFALQGNIAIGSKWGIETTIGYEHLNSAVGGYYIDHANLVPGIPTVDLLEFGVAARYYMTPKWFVKLGLIPYLALGNEDLIDGSIAGSAALGYQLKSGRLQQWEFTFNTDFVDIDGQSNSVIAVTGLRVAYQFNFRSR